MKNIVTMALILMLATTSFAAGPTVSFNPEQSRAAVGDSVSVDLVMHSFPTCEGGGVTLYFNPAVVKVVSVTVNTSLWTFASDPGKIDNTNGTVSDIWFGSFSGAGGDGVIATIQMQATKSGKTKLHLEESSLNPFASGGNRLPVVLQDGFLNVGGKKGGDKGKKLKGNIIPKDN